MRKKIFIAGGGGMLGEGFYQVFKDDYELLITDLDTNESWISHLDFRDVDEYKKQVRAFKPDYLFHLGAHTSLEYCDTHPDEAYETNTLAVENAVHISNELNIPLLYISTAGIFDGKQETYDDWDTPNPLGHYARSKYMGELFVKENKRKHIICRAGWMMGAGPKKDKKFVQKLMAQIKEGKKELFVVNDKLGTPTYTHDFARNVKLLLEKEYWGLYNLVCGGETGRFEVAEELVRLLGKEKEIKLTPVDSDYFKKEFFSHRPPSERLINTKLILRKCNIIRDWKTCLKEYLDNYYQGYL
ncbi:MAG: sugar nucleotide-binding protein [Bacteroidota bacterium]